MIPIFAKPIVAFFFLLIISGFLCQPSRAQDTNLLVSQIMDRDIYNEHGEQIGEIDDLVVRRKGKAMKVTSSRRCR